MMFHLVKIDDDDDEHDDNINNTISYLINHFELCQVKALTFPVNTFHINECVYLQRLIHLNFISLSAVISYRFFY
jgi:hypothetical protein